MDLTSVVKKYQMWAAETIPERKCIHHSTHIFLSKSSITGPRKQEDDIATNYKVLRDADDIPVFPDGDLSSEHPEVVRKVLEGYIIYLWGKHKLHSITTSYI